MPQPFYLGDQGQSTQLDGQPTSQYNPDIAQRANSSIDQLFGLLKPVTSFVGQEFVQPTVETLASPFTSPETAHGLGVGAGNFVNQVPRLAADVAATRLPGGIGKVAGFGDVALQGYANTTPEATVPQRLANAGIQTAAFAAAPKVAEGAERVSGQITRPLAQATADVLGPHAGAFVRTAGEKGGGYLGTLATLEAANAAGLEIQGENYGDYITNPEYIGANLVGGALMDIPGLVHTRGDYNRNLDLFKEMERFNGGEGALKQAMAESAAKASMLTRQRDELEKELSPDAVSPAMWNKDQLIGDTSFGWKMSEFANTEEGKQPRSTQQMFGRLKNLFPDEWSMFGEKMQKQFNPNVKVTGEDVQGWIEKNAPRVEVKPIMATSQADPRSVRHAELVHSVYDTLSPDEKFDINQFVREPDNINYNTGEKLDDWFHRWHKNTPELEAKVREYINLSKDLMVNKPIKTDTSESATARYSMVNPKPLDQMPGAVDLLVRIPFTPAGKTAESMMQGNNKPVKYSSSHYPTEGKNLLAHVRGYMETLPDGKKAFHVFEVQSDWAQAHRESQNVEDRSYYTGETREERIAQREAHNNNENTGNFGAGVRNDPLLKHYERLALKSAIDHAIKQGADYIALSDAETAMITEGHDRNLTQQHGYEQGLDPELYPTDLKPVQEKGMRLHYDQTLPRILEDLTGEKGKVVDFGEHQNAFQEFGDFDGPFPRTDLIFKTPTGQPKTTSTARLFSLDHARASITERGGIPLLGSKLTAPPKPKPLHTDDLNLLSVLESSGVRPDELSTIAQALDTLRRDPKQTFAQATVKQLFGDKGLQLDNERPNPNKLLTDATSYLNHVTKTLYGYDDQTASWWTKRILSVVARAGHTQGETRLFPSVPWQEDGLMRGASFYSPARNDLPNAFIGVLPKSGVGRDQAMFDIMHAIGHELFHGAILQSQEKTYVGPKLPDQFTKHANELIKEVGDWKLSPVEMEQSIDFMLQSVGGKSGGMKYRSKYYTDDAAGRQEYLADMFGLVSMSTLEPKGGKSVTAAQDFLKFAPTSIREFARSMFAEISKVWSLAKSFMQDSIGWRKGGRQLDSILDNMKGMVKSVEYGDAAAEAALRYSDVANATPWSPIENLDYRRVQQLHAIMGLEGYDPETLKMVSDVAPMVVPMEGDSPTNKRLKEDSEYLQKGMKVLDFFKATAQLARDIPEYADMARLGRNHAAMTTESAANMWDSFRDPSTGKVNLKLLRTAHEEGSGINKAINKIGLTQNAVDDGKNVRLLTKDEKEALPEYKALSKEDRQTVDHFLSLASVGVQHAAHMHVRSFKNEIALKVAGLFQGLDRSMSWSEARDLGKAITDIHVEQDRMIGDRASDPGLWDAHDQAILMRDKYFAKDPQNIVRWMKAEEALTKDEPGQPTLTSKFMEFRGKLLGDWKPLDPAAPAGMYGFSGKPGYMPEVRTGRWQIHFKNNEGVFHSYDYKNKKDWETDVIKFRKQQEKGDLAWVKQVDKNDSSDLYAGLRPDAGQVLAEAIGRLNNRVISKLELEGLAPEMVAQLRQELSPEGELAKTLQAPYMKERALVAGRERLNMVEGLIHYVNATAHTVAKRNSIGEQRLYLNDPKMRDNPNLQKNAREYFKEIVDPTERGFKHLKGLVALNYIFFSPSLAVIEGTQQLMNHWPALISQGMGVGEAMKSIGKANVDKLEAVQAGLKSGQLRKYDTAEKQRAYEDAIRKGIIDEGSLREVLHTEEDLNFINSRSLLAGNGKIHDVGSLLSNGWYWIAKFGKEAHSVMIRHNAEVGFMSSFEHFKSKGMDYDHAFQAADDLVHESMHGGGRASRPLWFLGVGKDQLPNVGSNVGGLMYLLQTYTFNTIAQQARYLKNSVTSSPLSQSERTSALKAGATMLGVQLLLAGVQGIPFSGQALALIEQFFPEAEPKRRIREWLQDGARGLVGDDDGLVRLISDAAWGGLANAAGPWDLSSRFQLGGLMGVDPYKGFAWENMVGPVGGLTSSLIRGVQNKDWAEAIPNTNLKRLVQTASNGWDSRNKDERLNVDLTTSEATMLALGFQPKRVKEFQEYDQMKRRAEKVETLLQKQFHAKVASLVMEGQIGEARQQLLQHAVESQGTYDPREGARRVAELVQARTTPHDPGREGATTGDSYAVSRLFERPQGLPTETQRLEATHQLMDMMGFHRAVTRTELKSAQMIDYLVATNPYLSRVEAKGILERQAGRNLRGF